MKILIPFDGSDCSKAAIEDLTRAGLPERDVHAHILTEGEYSYDGGYVPIERIWSLEIMKDILEEATCTAKHVAAFGAEKVRSHFPNWKVTCSTGLHSPASEILSYAEREHVDLIVMGSHGRSRLKRIVLGSVSLRVMSEAPCSVRIVKETPQEGEISILLAFDGSPGSRAAIRAIMRRCWPDDTSVHVLSIADSSLLSAWDYLAIPKNEVWNLRDLDESKLEHVMHSVEHELGKRFRTVTSSLVAGFPTRTIVNRAEALGVNMIVLGASGLSGVERLLLGSVAHGVASRAHCSVEIVR